MKSFKQYIKEASGAVGATEMEKHIVIAFNGGYQNAPDTYGIKAERYMLAKPVAEKIAKQIREKTGASKNSMIHFGSGKGEMISWWKGSPTPKTDIYSTDGINISLKQKGGSQLMSGLKDETLSTFKAATMRMDDESVSVDSLIKDLKKVLKSIVVPGNIDTMTSVIKDPKRKIPSRIKAPNLHRTGMVDVKIDKEEYKKKMEQMIDWRANLKTITPKISKFFETNADFKLYFCHEASTGYIKFKPDPHADSNWIVEFDAKTGDSDIERLSGKNGAITTFTKSLAKKAKIRIAAKTPTGSRVSNAGTSKTSGSFRIDIKEDSDITAESIIKEEIDLFCDTLLTEETLSENKILSWFRNVMGKIINTITTLAKKGLQAILKFFGYEPDKIETSGLEMFGY